MPINSNDPIGSIFTFKRVLYRDDLEGGVIFDIPELAAPAANKGWLIMNAVVVGTGGSAHPNGNDFQLNILPQDAQSQMAAIITVSTLAASVFSPEPPLDNFLLGKKMILLCGASNGLEGEVVLTISGMARLVDFS